MSDQEGLSLQTIDEAEIDTKLDADLKAFLCVCFPSNQDVFSRTRAWHGSHPTYSVLLRDGETIVGHASVVDRRIHVGSTPLRIAGIMNVAVLPEYRGKKLVDRILRAAMERARSHGMDIGLLFCRRGVVPIYSRNGWQEIRGQEAIRIESGKELLLPPDNFAMFFPLRLTQFPPGKIHLQGNDW
jgi:aminoglycoside 2'-N-acetyltransferase I